MLAWSVYGGKNCVSVLANTKLYVNYLEDVRVLVNEKEKDGEGTSN